MAVSNLTKEQICNMALGIAGSRDFIDSLAEGSEQSDVCNLYYDQGRKKVLRAYAWSFARQRQVLTATTLVRTGWSYVYKAPDDHLVIKEIHPSGLSGILGFPSLPWRRSIRSDQRIPFKIENDPPDPIGQGLGKIILCDLADPEAWYIADCEDTTIMTESYTEPLSYWLGSKFAYNLLSDPAKGAGLYKEYKSQLLEGIEEDINEAQEDPLPPSIYEAIREGGAVTDIPGFED